MTFYKGIIDSTLREGQQYYLANSTQSEQRKTVQMLSPVGVDRIEVENPVVSKVASNYRASGKDKEHAKTAISYRKQNG